MASQNYRVRVVFGWGDAVLLSEESYTDERARSLAETIAEVVGPEACVEVLEVISHENLTGRRSAKDSA